MRGSGLWSLSLSVVLLLGLSQHLGWTAKLLPRLGLGTSSESPIVGLSELPESAPHEPVGEPVLVVTVESRALLEHVRSKFAKHRIVASGRDVFALDGGCIFAYDLEAVGAPLTKLGWAHRPLQIVGGERPGSAPEALGEPSASSTTPVDGPRLIGELAKKDKLTPGDAMLLLEHIDDPTPYGRSR